MLHRSKLLNFIYWYLWWLLLQQTLMTFFVDAQNQQRGTNLTNWREHRRQKRFILFENAGISKLVCGITYPVDLSDKRPWRQLVLTFNLQYQFPVPPRPIYYWDKWDEDRALKKGTRQKSQSSGIGLEMEGAMPTVDEAQMFLYQFAIQFMNKQEIDGLACLQKVICESAQLHGHDGLFAELVQRILIPHKSLDAAYHDAYRAGKHGAPCQVVFSNAKNCPLDRFLHLREEVFEDEYSV